MVKAGGSLAGKLSRLASSTMLGLVRPIAFGRSFGLENDLLTDFLGSMVRRRILAFGLATFLDFVLAFGRCVMSDFSFWCGELGTRRNVRQASRELPSQIEAAN